MCLLYLNNMNNDCYVWKNMDLKKDWIGINDEKNKMR